MTTAQPRRRFVPGRIRGRRAARLAAAQALYQMELAGDDCESVVQQFIEHRFPLAKGSEPDAAFFAVVVRGVPNHQAEIDRTLRGALNTDWPLKRIDATLRAILRAATFEMLAKRDVPAKVIIEEYVEVAKAFFQNDEPSFANAVLDKIARRKRADEFGETPPDDEADF